MMVVEAMVVRVSSDDLVMGAEVMATEIVVIGVTIRVIMIAVMTLNLPLD